MARHRSDLLLPEALTARLSALATLCQVPPHTVALAGVALLLRRYTGRAEQTIRWQDADSYGDVSIDLTDDGPVRQLLAQVDAAMDQVAVAPVFIAEASGEAFADGVAVALRPAGPRWEISIEDCPDELSECLTADLEVLLGAIDPDWSTADLLPQAAYERRQSVDLARLHGRGFVDGGSAGLDIGPQSTICTAFAMQVARHPDRPAVLADDACLTYRQLGSAVAATASAIQAAPAAATARAAGTIHADATATATARSAGDPGRIALLCQHGASTVTALLAALTTGRAYVPLDPTFPAQRLAHILADSGADVLLTDAVHADLAQQLIKMADRPDLPTVHVGQPTDEADLGEVLAGLDSTAQPDDPAYVLYTSGSTGAPKGVVQSHRNVLFGVANHVRNFAISPDDRTSVLTSFGYDMAVTDTFSAILSGAAAVPADIRANGLGHLADTLARQHVTIYHSTPTVYRYLLASLGAEGVLPDIRAVLLGGEEVIRHDVELARRHFAPDAVFVNGYGTTEISFAAQCHLPADAPLDHAVVPIGQPLDGIDVVLVDSAGRPTCLTGEILVRCPHVALGYWGLPELTASRFVDYRGVRSYLTGDLARRLPDGRLIFLGRADRLVKIRGYRVELGEVEAQLAALPGVGQVAVIARFPAERSEAPETGPSSTVRISKTGSQDKEIIGYVVPARDAIVDPTALRAALAVTLPDFMLPRAVVVVDTLPMGATGKLDVHALPEPPVPSTMEVDQDPLERLIATAWCDVLGLDRVDRRATFVELGGHSLLMALVQQRLESTLGQRLPLARLFEHPTIAGLAAHLRAGTPTGPSPELARAADRMRRRRQARHGTEDAVGASS